MSEVDETVPAPTMVPMHLFDDANGVYLGAFSKPFPEGFPPPGAVEVSEPHDIAPSPAQALAVARAKLDKLLSTAALRIAPLQDAVDLGDATDTDTASLKAWKQYRVAVNRVTEQSGFPASIDWPVAPDREQN